MKGGGAQERDKTLIGQLLFKRLTIKGSTLRSRDASYQQNLLEKFQELALPLLKEKKMKIEVHEVGCPIPPPLSSLLSPLSSFLSPPSIFVRSSLLST